MPSKFYTVASGSNCGHCTSLHVDLDEVCTEVDSLGEEYQELILEHWNTLATALNSKGEKEIPLKEEAHEMSFKEFMDTFPEGGWHDEGGWGASGEHDRLGSMYLNISVHIWNGKFFQTTG